MDESMLELEDSVRVAKEELARIDAELQKLHQAHHERIVYERARHEDALRDIDARFFYEREPLQKMREALVSTFVDMESMKLPQPRIIGDIAFTCDPTLPANVVEARHADGRVDRFKFKA